MWRRIRIAKRIGRVRRRRQIASNVSQSRSRNRPAGNSVGRRPAAETFIAHPLEEWNFGTSPVGLPSEPSGIRAHSRSVRPGSTLPDQAARSSSGEWPSAAAPDAGKTCLASIGNLAVAHGPQHRRAGQERPRPGRSPTGRGSRGWLSNPWFFSHKPPCAGRRCGRSAPPGSPRIRARRTYPARTWPETGRCPKRRRAPHIRCNPFRPDRRDIGAKRGQDFVAEAWLGGYDGHYTDHCRSRCCRSVPRAMPKLTSAGPLSPQGRPPEPAGGPGAAD